MKNLLKLMLCLLGSVFFVLPQETYAKEIKNVTMTTKNENSWLQKLEAQGIHAEKLNNAKLIDELSNVEHKSKSEIAKEYAINLHSQANGIYDNYSFTFYKHINVVKQSKFGIQARHVVYAKIYNSGSFHQILGVYNGCVLMPTGPWTWETGVNYINSWNATHITFTSAGNGVYATSLSAGVSFTLLPGVSYGTSSGSTNYYRINKTYTDTVDFR